MGKFKITDSQGFHITFDNGVTLSTQFGPSNYCEHYPDLRSEAPSMVDFEAPREERHWECSNAEIAIWIDGEEEWITHEMIKDLFPEELYEDSDMKVQVKGWVEMEDWLKIFDWCRNY